MDAEPRALTPIPCGVAAARNSWLKSLAKPLLLLGLFGLTGCASLNKPLTEEECDERIRSWNLPTPNPWFWNDQNP
jgi:hypothetical protein